MRQGLGRKPTTRFLIVDAQSVKNTDTAEQKGFDGGKLISGIERPIGVDTNGLPHALDVTTAAITDRKGGLQAFDRHKDNLPDVENVLADGGYTGEPQACARFWPQPSKSPNVMNCINLRSSPNVGWSSAPSLGSKNTAGFGKTASVSSIPAAI